MASHHVLANPLQDPAVQFQNGLQNPCGVKSLHPHQSPRYEAALPDDIGPFKKLLQEYTCMPERELDLHIRVMRDKAHAIARYSVFGLWGFTRIDALDADLIYHLALSRLRAPNLNELFIDVGCGLGQNIRQLLYAGVPALKIGAMEMPRALFDVGLQLFRDIFSQLSPNLLVADLIKGDTQRFARTATILHVANLFPLFDWRNQLIVAHNLTKFLQAQVEGEDEKRIFIFGSQVGSLTPGEREAGQEWEERYLHNQESFQRLWDTMYWVTGWQWKVEVEMLGNRPRGYDYLGDNARYQRFVV